MILLMLNCIFGIQIKLDFKLKMNSLFCDIALMILLMLNCILGIQIRLDFKLKMNSLFCDIALMIFTHVELYFQYSNKVGF